MFAPFQEFAVYFEAHFTQCDLVFCVIYKTLLETIFFIHLKRVNNPFLFQAYWNAQLLIINGTQQSSMKLQIIHFCLSWKHTTRITISLMLIRSSHIYDFHIFIFIYNHYHRVYDELTIDYLSMWLDSSVDRVLHRYRKVMGSSLVQAWIFFWLLFQLLKLKAHWEEEELY